MTHSHDTSTPAMSAETVPSEEFVLVPREATERMLKAADGWTDLIDAAGGNTPESRRSEFRVAWRAMIDAAPASIPSPAATGGEAKAKAKQALYSLRFEGQPMSSMFSAEELGLIVDTVSAVLSTPTEGPASQTEGMGGDALRERIARALNGVLGSEEDEHPRHHPAQNSWEKPSEVWWTQWLEAADAVIAALTPPETAEAVPVASSEEPIGWQLYLQPLARWGRHINTKATADEAVAGFPASSVPIARPLYAHPAPATDDRERLVETLRKIEEEAKVANDVIRLNRDERGQGRVRVATAMHRIAEWTRAALATEASR